MSEIYSQGVAGDGPVILCDGLPMTPDMIVEVLNRFVSEIKQLEAENQRLRDVLIRIKSGILGIESVKYLAKETLDEL